MTESRIRCAVYDRPMTQSEDLLWRFWFDQMPVRGALVRVDNSFAELIDRQQPPTDLRPIFAELLAASALLLGPIKFDGKLILQMDCRGPARLLFAEAHSAGVLRGIVRATEQPGPLEVQRLVLTIDRGHAAHRYQGIVDARGDSLANMLGDYFAQSEQLPSLFVLASDGVRARGLMVQRTPDGGPVLDPDGWDRIGHLMATISPAELLQVDGEVMLHRLFHDESLHRAAPQALRFGCSCNPTRAAGAIRLLGAAEAFDALAADPQLAVRCEFCGQQYRFDQKAVEAVFIDESQASARLQ